MNEIGDMSLDRWNNRAAEQKRRERRIVSKALCDGVAPGNKKKQHHTATDDQGHGIVPPAACRLANGIQASAGADHKISIRYVSQDRLEIQLEGIPLSQYSLVKIAQFFKVAREVVS